MNNIRQKTNLDLTGGELKNLYIDGELKTNLNYKEITFENNNVFKFGYCVNDNEGIKYPIFLTFSTDNDDEEREFRINPATGIFEFQSEEWRDLNNDNTEKTAEVFVRKLKVYENVPFVVDYCYLA